ncbi:MAG: hypothetical protein C0483_04410 [Pirellula sp.]|nr:hypothetical protein [Pirellula sp.]
MAETENESMPTVLTRFKSLPVRPWLKAVLALLPTAFFAGALAAETLNTATSTTAPKVAAASTFQARLDESLIAESQGSAIAGAVTTVKRVDDEAFVRRVYLDIVGQWPTAAELTAFVLDPSANKRSELVSRLLEDRRYGENWGRYWRDVVLYRRAEDRALLMQGTAAQYFSEVLNVNATWDTIAAELITASGDVSEQGSTVLFMAQMGDPNEVASEVSRIFCGVQISCAQCHDHPTDRWKREQFHQLAAFFPRTFVRPVVVDGQQRSYAVDSRDFGPRFMPAGADANNPRFRPIEHYMPDLKDPASQGTLMQPVFFVTGQKLPEEQTDMQRRETLAKWLASPENPWFAKALVNRLWAELVGEGFYEPVDDIGPDRRCSAPKTLELLATEFTKQGYDLKWLYRTILATEAYQRESRPQRNPEDPSFAANCAHRIRADQLYDALLNALGLPSDDAVATGMYQQNPRFALGSPRAQFSRVFGYDPSSKRDEVTGSIPQALLLMNAPNLAAGINGRSTATTLGKLLAEDRKDESVVVELYLRCLAREPNAKELAVCLEHVKQTENRVEAFEDLLWSIVNSTEFLHRQ